MVRLLARLLAPLALAAVAVGVYLIVHTTIVKHDASTGRSKTTHHSNAKTHHRKAKPKPKFYIVKAGDSLSSIASATGVSQRRLTALNPAVSNPPYSLQTGQRLRLRR